MTIKFHNTNCWLKNYCPRRLQNSIVGLRQLTVNINEKLAERRKKKESLTFLLLEIFVVVEFKFLFVVSEHCLHVLHTLFQNLHFLIQLDFLFNLVLRVLTSHGFQLFSLFTFLSVSFVLEILLSLLVDFKQLFDLIFY